MIVFPPPAHLWWELLLLAALDLAGSVSFPSWPSPVFEPTGVPLATPHPRITTQSGDSRGGLVDVPVEPGADCDIRKEERFSLRGLRGPGKKCKGKKSSFSTHPDSPSVWGALHG